VCVLLCERGKEMEIAEDLGAALTEGGRLADSAARLLSDVNIFAARLSDCLTELNLKAARPTQAATHCERALAAYMCDNDPRTSL
jgi:hypothetical protein